MTADSPASLPSDGALRQRAFYLLRPGGWRDYVNVLHLPYTVWHLSYVILGTALVPTPSYPLLGWTLLAFFLAMGVGAHVLDEWRGRPLSTTIPGVLLVATGLVAVVAAILIGLVIGLQATPWVLPFIVVGAWLVLAYNLEWGPFHHSAVFALAWGAFPVLTSYVAQAGTVSIGSVLVAAGAAVLSYAQRILSKRARYLRREVLAADGYLETAGGVRQPISLNWLLEEDDMALLFLSISTPVLAIGFLLR